MKRILFAFGALGLMATAAAADSTHRIDRREDRQIHRITNGAEHGSLNRHETRRLLHNQARIRRMERHAMADGVVTRHERRRIREAQNRQDRAIRDKKHDWR
ncbi:MAG TPA: hypothetical protein VHC71_13070 [Hyphomicrobium sp.]|nr:hypothetical protein [Hyphomicrobium sp.]